MKVFFYILVFLIFFVDVPDQAELEKKIEDISARLKKTEIEETHHKANRAEKKAKKALCKHGIVAFPGVQRVMIKKSKNLFFTIADPEVYKLPKSDYYIIFGEAKV